MTSYLDSGALSASGFAIGGFYVGPLGLDALTIGALLGLQTLAFAVGAVSGGLLSDRLGRRRVLLTALFAYAIGVALLAAAHAHATLAAGAILTGLAIGADLPSSLALLSEETPTRKARSLAISQLLWVIGLGTTATFAFVLSDLGETAGRLLFVHLLAVSLIVLALRVNLPESREWRTAHHDAHHGAIDSGDSIVEAPPHDQAGGSPFGAFGSVGPSAVTSAPVGAAPEAITGRSFRMPSVVVVVTAYYTLWNLGANTLGQFRPYLWTHILGGTGRSAAALVLLAVPFAIIGGLMFARLADSPLRGRWLITASILTTAGWLCVAISPSRPTFVALVFCFAATAAVSGEAMYKIWIHDFVPTLSRATVQGASLAAARVVTSGFVLLTPPLARFDPRLLFAVICAASAAAALIAVHIIVRRSPPAPRPSQPG